MYLLGDALFCLCQVVVGGILAERHFALILYGIATSILFPVESCQILVLIMDYNLHKTTNSRRSPTSLMFD